MCGVARAGNLNLNTPSAPAPQDAVLDSEAFAVATQDHGALRMAGATHQGKARDHNEDCFALRVLPAVAVVSDGVGGLEHGAQASRRVCEALMRETPQHTLPSAVLQQVHQELRQQAASGESGRSGATAVAALVDGTTLNLYWAGDSRAYLLRGGQLEALTSDHSFVGKMVEIGAITAEEALRHPGRNIITNAVGISTNALVVSEKQLSMQPGDRIMLCSDGLYAYLPEADMLQILRQEAHAGAAVRALMRATLIRTEAGDNVTVVCLDLLATEN